MRTSLAFAAILVVASVATAQSLTGLWDASVVVNGIDIPFRFEFAGEGTNLRGSFFNGDEKVTSTSGNVQNGSVLLNFAHYATKLDATVKDGRLEGTYGREGRIYPFQAKRFVPSALTSEEVPSIAGLWEIGVKSPKGESAWRFIVRQSGPEVSAAILRVDGDTGALTGTYKNSKFVLSHFSGARPSLFVVTPLKDGSIKVAQSGKPALIAFRSAEARAKGLPEPTDPSRHTSVKDPSVPFEFSFPDLSGKTVSNTDPRFRGKVVIVAISGSWCPNCHDEAPFLEALYRKYQKQGLEIVSLSFEEGDQLKNPARLRAFIKQYGITFPVLLGGEPDELKDKLTQAVNLNAWPTTFYLGRDGLVKSVHAGFAGVASGGFHKTLEEEVTTLVERLLAENIRTSR